MNHSTWATLFPLYQVHKEGAILRIVPPSRLISSCKKIVELLINITPRKSYAYFVSKHHFLSTRIQFPRNWPKGKKLTNSKVIVWRKTSGFIMSLVWKTKWCQWVNSLYIINFIRNDSCTKKGKSRKQLLEIVVNKQ